MWLRRLREYKKNKSVTTVGVGDGTSDPPPPHSFLSPSPLFLLSLLLFQQLLLLKWSPLHYGDVRLWKILRFTLVLGK
ncbi:hypothetical protein E2C01_069325 [Portunus trituberculatus]|uniref:Uncharacterized protein n=1 Tax=Portunus trituberculatus TaxID=210409 RepID=A0A5B7HU81_PORTR|nr:hypothetical protein [Portunus trituberculatus]